MTKAVSVPTNPRKDVSSMLRSVQARENTADAVVLRAPTRFTAASFAVLFLRNGIGLKPSTVRTVKEELVLSKSDTYGEMAKELDAALCPI